MGHCCHNPVTQDRQRSFSEIWELRNDLPFLWPASGRQPTSPTADITAVDAVRPSHHKLWSSLCQHCAVWPYFIWCHDWYFYVLVGQWCAEMLSNRRLTVCRKQRKEGNRLNQPYSKQWELSGPLTHTHAGCLTITHYSSWETVQGRIYNKGALWVLLRPVMILFFRIFT